MFKKADLVFGLAASGLLACAGPAGYDVDVPEPGVLQLVGHAAGAGRGDSAVRWQPEPLSDVLTPPVPLVVPDTVDAGVPFEVVTRTIGMNGCWAASGQSIRIQDPVIEITPRDVHSGADVCTEILLFLPHTSTVTLTRRGEWLVRVDGRRLRLGYAAWEEPARMEKTIFVR